MRGRAPRSGSGRRRRTRSTPGRERCRPGRDGRPARPRRGSPRSRSRSTRGRARSRPRRRRRSRGRARASSFFSSWYVSAAIRSASEKLSAPAGTTMNSCRSIELSAWTPPLITFSIGTGRCRRVLAAEVAEERHVGVGGSRLRRRERNAEDRVGAEPSLVRRPVELDQCAVEVLLVGHVGAADRLRDLAVDVCDRGRDALAAPLGAAVAKLDRLVHAGRGARGDDRPPALAGDDLHLDRGIPTRVQHLPRVHLGDAAHSVLSFAWSKYASCRSSASHLRGLTL